LCGFIFISAGTLCETPSLEVPLSIICLIMLRNICIIIPIFSKLIHLCLWLSSFSVLLGIILPSLEVYTSSVTMSSNYLILAPPWRIYLLFRTSLLFFLSFALGNVWRNTSILFF
jgi:hypothetical protein